MKRYEKRVQAIERLQLPGETRIYKRPAGATDYLDDSGTTWTPAEVAAWERGEGDRNAVRIDVIATRIGTEDQ